MTDLDWSLSKAKKKRRRKREQEILAGVKDGLFVFAVIFVALLSLGVAG